jgi:transcriptional regulator with XRE-family HTH domain
MFWERFYSLCIENNTKPNPVARELGIASGTLTQWKNGTVPSSKIVETISDYFNVSVDYLLGKTDIKNKPTVKNGEPMSDEDVEILKLFRELSPDERARHIEVLRVLLRKDGGFKK